MPRMLRVSGRVPCLMFAALVSIVGGTRAAAKPATANVADFVRAPDFSQVSLSPDGEFIAALAPRRDTPGQNLLVIFSTRTAKPLRTIKAGGYQLIGSYAWVGDHRIIATLAMQLNGLDTPQPTGELYGIDADGRHAITLFGFRADPHTETGIGQRQASDAAARLIGTVPGDAAHVLIATSAFDSSRTDIVDSIERLNVLTGATRRLGAAPAANAGLLSDHAGQVRAAWASDDFVAPKLWTRPDNASPWVLRNDPSVSGQTLIPLGFDRSNQKLYLRATQQRGPDAIALLDMRTGQRTQVYQGAFADAETLLPTADDADYYAIFTADGRKGLHYLDGGAREAAITKALAGNFPGRLAYLSSFSRDGKHALIREVSDRNPGDYYLLDVASQQAHFLFSSAARIDPRRMHAMQPISLAARDGLALHGYLTQPSEPDSGSTRPPMVVLVHGGPFGVSDAWRYDPEVQLFASRGYAVLQVNYRGSGGYGGRFEGLGYRQWGQAMETDVLDATHWAVAQGYADPARLCIYGASYGGYAAMEAVVQEPDLFACAIGYAGVYDMRVQLDHSDTQQRDAGRRFLEHTMGHDRAALLAHSPLAGVDRIRAKLLLIHGGKDPRVPFRNFQEFTRALDQAHKHYIALPEPDEGHGFFVEAHRIAAYRAMVDFLDDSIGPSRAVQPAARPAPDR